MSRDDKEEIKEILRDYVAGIIARQDAKFDIIDNKLDLIKEQTTKHNGRMSKIEDRQNKHEMLTSLITEDRIRVIEDRLLTTDGIKKWIAQSVATTSIIISIVFSILNYFI